MKTVYIDTEYVRRLDLNGYVSFIARIQRYTDSIKVVFGDISLYSRDSGYHQILDRLKHKHLVTISHVPSRTLDVTSHMLVAIQHSVSTGAISEEVIIFTKDTNYNALAPAMSAYGIDFKVIDI